MFKLIAVTAIPGLLLLALVLAMGGETEAQTLARLAGQDQFISSLL